MRNKLLIGMEIEKLREADAEIARESGDEKALQRGSIGEQPCLKGDDSKTERRT